MVTGICYHSFIAAGLPEQKERLRVTYSGDLTDDKRFAPLKEYAAKWEIADKFSERQYVIDAGKPKISGTRQHFWDNLERKVDRSGLNIEAEQRIIDNSKLTLYQTDKMALKFISDSGYTVINLKKEIITVVPEKLRKKYREYLEGGKHGKKPDSKTFLSIVRQRNDMV